MFMTVATAAEKWNVSVSAVRGWCAKSMNDKSPVIHGVHLFGKTYLIPASTKKPKLKRGPKPKGE